MGPQALEQLLVAAELQQRHGQRDDGRALQALAQLFAGL
jgi:hypothetical protein